MAQKAKIDHKRHLLKTITWRIIATILTFIIALLLTGEVHVSLGIMSIEFFVKMFFYYLHERIWYKSNFGIKHETMKKLDKKINNNHVFFWGGVFSNFYPAEFTVDETKFYTSEQYFMWGKAVAMNDMESAQKILAEKNPGKCKALGRQVKPYNESLWDNIRESVMYTAIYHKFNQNENLKKELLATGDKIIVEASPTDKIWGIGIGEEDAPYIPEEDWPGQNLLGKALMKLREEFKNK